MSEMPFIQGENLMNTQTILRGLRTDIKRFLSGIEPNVSINYNLNHLDFKTTYPTDKQFRSFIFNTLKEKGYMVNFDTESPYDIIYITLDGYKMPVITSFNLTDNIYDPGSIECSVWINDNVKEPV